MTTNHLHELRPLTQRQLQGLMNGLRQDRVSSRRGTGSSTLSYLEAWDVKATLIKVFGFGGFSSEVIESKIERIFDKAEYGGNAAWVVLASATVRLTIHQLGAVYTETAVSSQAGSQIGEVGDFAMKTAESDALKRAAVFLGTQFGLSLYNAGSTADVVTTVLEPGQRGTLWPGSLQSFDTIPGQNPAAPAPAPEQQPAVTQEPAVHGEAGDRYAAAPLPEGITAKQRQDNIDLLNKAMSAKALKDPSYVPATPEAALIHKMAQSGADVPMYADTSLDERGDEAEAYAAADGYSE